MEDIKKEKNIEEQTNHNTNESLTKLEDSVKQTQSKAEAKFKGKKKEVQGTIIQIPSINGDKATEDEFLSMLKMVSPGTNLRAAIEGILKAECGALIVIENDVTPNLIDGGFRVNCRFTPQRLVELSKMDGAMILSKDVKKINDANVLLTPDSKIKTSETGTRHKAAERTAKQAGTPVIAVSERRGEVTLFYKNIKYPLRSADVILRRANEHLHHMEKQREIFDKEIEKLNKLELRNHPSLHKAILATQKGRLIQKIAQDIKRNIIELGNEATLIKTRLKEITKDVDKEINLIIKDYTKLDLKKSKILLESLTYDEILDENNILRALAYEKLSQSNAIKGWRILSKTTLEEPEIAALIKHLGSLGKAIHSNPDAYSRILGEDKALTFKEEIDKIKLNQ
jgi:diadenylate cyclase